MAAGDFYATPAWVTYKFMDLNLVKNHHRILEPCAGIGSIVEVLHDCLPQAHITAIEIQKEFEDKLIRSRPTRHVIGDFLKVNFIAEEKFDWVITNPPYGNNIEDFIIKSLRHVKENGRVAMLLRLALLSGIKRHNFIKQYRPSAIYLSSRRVVFTDEFADICPYGWVIWDNPITDHETTLHWLSP